jgi:ERCC4-type nuclease
MSTLVIEIDNREKERSNSKEPTVPEELEKFIKENNLDIPIVYKQLEIGDYKIGDYICERKSPIDFCNSKFTGHMNNQMFDMSANEPLSIFFVEGDLFSIVEQRFQNPDYWMKCAFFGIAFKIADQNRKGWILPIRTYNQTDTARWLRVIYDKVKAGEFIRFPEIEREGKNKPTDNDWLIFTVSSFSGIGKLRAIELLKKHKTLRALMASTDWKCKGVGDKTNAEVQTLLDTEFTV